jgi:CheY-like chemotaxis protein
MVPVMARILIVEDNPDLLAILKELLSLEYEVLTARTGEDAIRIAQEEHPDLVILDLQLPIMDGMEAGRWIKSALAPAHVPILALTALAGAGDADAILSSGCCDAYMAKPAPLMAIKEEVSRLLESREPADRNDALTGP